MPRRRSPYPRSPPIPSDWHPPPLPSALGLLAAIAANAFSDMSVSASLWLQRSDWHAIRIVPSVANVEAELGLHVARWAYNDQHLERARLEGRPVLGERAGACDLFVPVFPKEHGKGILVVGPFARSRPSGADVLTRWLELTGTHGRLSDPSFRRYVELTLSTFTVEGALFGVFERYVQTFARLVAGRGDAQTLGGEMAAQREQLVQTRVAERMWETTLAAVDERATRSAGTVDHGVLAPLGVERIPESVVVGLLLGRGFEPDPLDEWLRRDAFLRASVALAREHGNVLVGPVGDHGVVMLADHHLADLATRAAKLARRFGFSLHAGIADERSGDTLPARYLASLWAAEKAVSEGRNVVRGEPRAQPTSPRLRQLRSELGKSAGEHPDQITAKFEQYAQLVVAHAGYRQETVRAHLDAGFERLAEAVATDGLLDPKSMSELWATIERSAGSGCTVAALLDAYRLVVGALTRALERPTFARRERSVERALRFVREHVGEDLPLARVARVAGIAPKYFSHVFHKSAGKTFARYLSQLRLERAKEMLKVTRLTVEQVARSCGYRTCTNFYRAFRNAVGTTPTRFRRWAG